MLYHWSHVIWATGRFVQQTLCSRVFNHKALTALDRGLIVEMNIKTRLYGDWNINQIVVHSS
jgi:hypothetical protein